MYQYFIPGLYVLAHLILFLILHWWLLHASRRYEENRRLWGLLSLGGAILCLIPLLGCFLPESGMKFALMRAGNIWLGFFAYTALFALPLVLLLPVTGLVRIRRTRVSRITARAVLTAVLGASLVLNIYGLIHAQDVKVHSLEVQVDKPLDAGTDSLRIALLGDLHMSVNSRPETIARMADLVNAQDADLVLVAGDWLTSTYHGLRDPEVYAEALRGIRAKYGKYAVYGNHDVEEPLLGGFPMTPISEAFRSNEVVDFISGCGFDILSDEVVEIVNGSLVLVGREDGEKSGRGTEERKEAKDLMAGIDTGKPVLVLEHEPVDFENLREAGADLVLCGHTHDGQFFPGNLITPFFNENSYGWKIVDGVQTVVTSGVGYYGPPLRVGTDSEVMMVTVRFAPSAGEAE